MRNRTILLREDQAQLAAARPYQSAAQSLLSTFGPRRLLLVTSPTRGEGKTTTASNLALAMQRRRLSVCLLELSLTRPVLQRIFGKASTCAGVEDVLSGAAQPDSAICIRNDSGLHLAVVKRPLSGSEADSLLEPGPRLDALLDCFAERFHWTIVDGPPLSDYPSLPTLARRIGLALVVGRIRAVTADALSHCVTQLQASTTETTVLING